MQTIRKLAALLTGLALLFCGGCAARGAEGTSGVSALFINVGKADAALLTVGEKLFLVDAGTAEAFPRLWLALQSQDVQALDGVFVTHTDKDHAGGLDALMQTGIPVGALYAPKFHSEESLEDHPVYQAAEQYGAPLTWLTAGERVPAGESAGFTVLGPLRQDDADENNNSLVLRLQTEQGDMLLTGDMEAEETADLLAAGSLAPAALLKVPHHGQADEGSKPLIYTVRPQIGVISTDTAVKENTAEPALKSLLWDVKAEIALTQDATCGILVTLAGGKASAQKIDYQNIPDLITGLTIEDVDRDAEVVTLRNDGAQSVTLDGCALRAKKSGSVYLFPKGTVLAPGRRLTIGTLSSPAGFDLLWNQEDVWPDKKKDTAILTDSFGREITTVKDGE